MPNSYLSHSRSQIWLFQLAPTSYSRMLPLLITFQLSRSFSSCSYLETDGKDAFVKPWVWILWLGGGPLIMSVTWQLYIFLSVRLLPKALHILILIHAQTGSLVRTEAIITSLVFDHALRIRLKAETAEKKTTAEEGATPPGTDTKGSRANTPDNRPESPADDETETETVHSRTTTAATSSTATAVSPEPAAAKGGTDSKDGKKPDAKDVAKEAEQKGKNLVGKINNLVTSDLDNIVSGRDFLFIGEHKIYFYLCFYYARL